MKTRSHVFHFLLEHWQCKTRGHVFEDGTIFAPPLPLYVDFSNLDGITVITIIINIIIIIIIIIIVIIIIINYYYLYYYLHYLPPKKNSSY